MADYYSLDDYSLRYENQRNRIIVNLPRNVEVSDKSLMFLLNMAIMAFKKDDIKECYEDVQTVEVPNITFFESKEGTSGTED